ncbi:MAG TPA: RNA polymerase sigma factor [Chloroflexia bacterium]|jgi:RNA polymerase sigma-70 factor (ECF subfamily)
MQANQESEAIIRLKQGDIGGLETLVRLHQTKAIRASYLISYNYTLAEDIVQAAFLRAYEQIAQFDARRPFGPWFMRIVVNDTLMSVTRRRWLSLDHESGAGAAQLPALTTDVAERLEAAETREAVWAALDRLSPHQRAAVVMRYYLDLSDAEISARLSVPQGTVRRRLHDARERLRTLLRRDLGFGI